MIFAVFNHSHKKRKDSLETQVVPLMIFSGVAIHSMHQKEKNGNFCEELLSENKIEAVLTSFYCYDHGAKASEVVQKIATDQKEYRKCSSCVIIC